MSTVRSPYLSGTPQTNIANQDHNHDSRYYTEAEVDSKISGKANAAHTHDDRYYTETEVNSKLADLKKKPTEYNLPIGTGFILYEGGKYCKTQDGIVFVNGRIATAGGTALNAGIHCVGILPAGYRPQKPAHSVASIFSTSASEIGAVPCWVTAAGKINVMIPFALAANASSAINYPAFGINCSFVAV